MSSGSPILSLPRPSRVSGYLLARLSAPGIDEDTLSAVLGRYGLRAHGHATNLELNRRSRNILVATDRGRKVVKRYRVGWPVASVAHTHTILLRLEHLGVPAPQLVRTCEGGTWARADGHVFAIFDRIAGRNRSLDLLRRRDRLRLVATAGRTLAGMHRSLAGFVPDGQHHLGLAPANGVRRHSRGWYLATLGELASRAAEVTGERVADGVTHLQTQAPAMLDAILHLGQRLAHADLPRVVIHGDFGLHNLLFRNPDEAVPVDFELSRLDWRVNDLILALTRFRSAQGAHAVESMETFLGAYAAVHPLTADEVLLLPDVWRLYELQAAVRHWNSYVIDGGPPRQVASAIARLAEADWVVRHPAVLRRLVSVAHDQGCRASATGRPIRHGRGRS